MVLRKDRKVAVNHQSPVNRKISKFPPMSNCPYDSCVCLVPLQFVWSCLNLSLCVSARPGGLGRLAAGRQQIAADAHQRLAHSVSVSVSVSV